MSDWLKQGSTWGQCYKTFYERNLPILAMLQAFENYGRKMFDNIGPRAQCYETFYRHNLLMLLIS
jgi:hypothetical protein